MNKNIINVTALDGLIKVNSFFSVAILISIIIAMLFKSLENLATASSNVVAEKLLIKLAICFRFFLFAWLSVLEADGSQAILGDQGSDCEGGISLTAFFSGFAFHVLFGSMNDVTGAETTHKMLSFSACQDSSAGGCIAGTVYMGLLLYFIGLCHLVFRGKYDDPQ